MNMNRAAGCILLPDFCDVRLCRNQYLLHGNLQQRAEGVEIVHGGKACSLLPFVDGLWCVEAEEGLHVPHAHTARIAQAEDVFSGGNGVDDRKGPDLHIAYLQI